MVKTDKAAKAAEKKARVAAKQAKKGAQKEKKQKTKAPKGGSKDDDSDADEDVDLDALLAEYALKQEQFLKVTELPLLEPPSPRSSATLTPSPSNSNELILFGGEYYNGSLATFFNDLLVYNIHRDEWRQVTSPNTPLPRSGHAACAGGNDSRGVYLFGGEFSSPKQGTFYHYNDFWRLDTVSREWTRLEQAKGSKERGGPPARSGHRMTCFKNYVVLFGGFQDTSQQTRYLNDLWLYDTQTFTWHQPALPPASARPDARSSFSFLPHDSGGVLYGGYSRVKVSASTSGKQGKGGKSSGTQGTRTVVKPFVHSDTWFLRITPPPPAAPPSQGPSVRWERRKKTANVPNPPRAGTTMAHHKGRGIMFGGVVDVEESEEGIESEFFDGLWAWNIDRNRFFQLTLRKPRGAGARKGGGGGAGAGGGGRRERGKANEQELLRNLAALGTDTTLTDDIPKPLDGDVGMLDGDQNGSPERTQKPMMMEMPHRRFNAQLAVQDDVLYIFGGTFENRDREYTFDEMWAVDLGKLDGVKELFKRELQNWEGSEEDESEDEEEDEDEDDSDEERDEDAMDLDVKDRKNPDGQRAKSPESVSTTTITDDTASILSAAETETTETTQPNSHLPFPRPFEALRDFYQRSSLQWQEIVIEASAAKDDVSGKSVKELKKAAFDLAEGRWWEVREEVRALEDEVEEAGIGEVVSIAERGAGDGGAGAGPGRRR